MKKAVSVLIACVLVLSLMPLSASATVGGSGMSFSIGSATARQGGTVTVPISVSGNPGFAGATFTVTYNPEVLTITDLDYVVAELENPQWVITTTPGSQRVSLISSDNWNGSGTIVNLKFNVASNAPAGTSPISIAFSSNPSGEPFNADQNEIKNVTLKSGSVTVEAGGANTPRPVNPHPGGGEDEGKPGLPDMDGINAVAAISLTAALGITGIVISQLVKKKKLKADRSDNK